MKKKLELLSVTPRATLTHLSCSPNFPRASYLDERTLTYEPIVNYSNLLDFLKSVDFKRTYAQKITALSKTGVQFICIVSENFILYNVATGKWLDSSHRCDKQSYFKFISIDYNATKALYQYVEQYRSTKCFRLVILAKVVKKTS